MIGSKAGAAGASRSCRQSTKRKLDTKRDPVGVAGVSGFGNGGSGFFGVRDSSAIVEIKKWVKDHNLYRTVKEGKLVAAIIHDVFRLCVDLEYSETFLNIRKVELCIQKEIQKETQKEIQKETQKEIQKEIQKEAQINLPTIGKIFLVEFLERNPVKLSDDSPDARFPLQLEGLTKEQFEVLKEKIVDLAQQCFRELREKIIREYSIQGRQKMDEQMIPPRLSLSEDNGSQVDDRTKALIDHFAKVVAEVPSLNGKSMLIEYLVHLLEENQDATSEAVRKNFIMYIEGELKKLESAQNLEDEALFFNPYVPQV